MRVGGALAAAFVLLITACSPELSRPSATPEPSPARSAPPGPVLAKLPVAATFGQEGIRVSPNGEMLLVVQREGFVHTIYDVAGRGLATLKLGEIGMNPFWLPDSSGVVVGRRIQGEAGGPYLLDISILEPDGSVRDIAHRVGHPRSEGQLVSPDGQTLAFDTPCCPSTVVLAARGGGTPRELATAPTQIRVLSWDPDGHVVYWTGGDAIDAARADGSRYRVPLGLPSGVKAVDIQPGVRTGDGVATLIGIQPDRSFPGLGDDRVTGRTLIARELRAYPTAAPLYGRLSPHEALTYAPGGSLGAYDLTTGATQPIRRIVNDDGRQPTALSAGLLMSSLGRTWIRILDIERDDRWHEADVGRILQAAGYALSRGRFLVFDEDGAPYVLDGAAARAAPARALPRSDEPNAVVGTVRAARNGVTGKKMELAWRMPDGAPRSLDHYAGSLVVINFWTRACVVCTQQLGLLSDVAVGRRLEIIAVGVDESEASALDAARDYERLRPLVGSRAALKDIGVDVLPQTFILDSDHVVRQVMVGPLSWDALVRALTAASKSRLALRDGDVALS